MSNKQTNIILFAFLLIVAFFHTPHFSQGFRGIVPLRSTCADVKRILNVKDCEQPQSRYRVEDMSIIVDFIPAQQPKKFERVCWRASPGTVKSVSTIFYKNLPLSSFEMPLQFAEDTRDDIGTKVYVNKEKGITAYVQQDIIDTVIYYPTPVDFKNFSFPCASADSGDGIDFSGVSWYDGYWNLTRAEEEARFKEMTPEILQSIENLYAVSVNVVFYYKSAKDIKPGRIQATRAKALLEKYGLAKDKIKIVNGGKELESKIVIYPDKKQGNL